MTEDSKHHRRFGHTYVDEPAGPLPTPKTLAAWASDHMLTVMIWTYTIGVTGTWIAALFHRVPRDTLGSEDIQLHWIPVTVHGIVGAFTGFVGGLERKDLTERQRILVLATFESAVAMVLISALVEAVCP